MTVTEQTLSRIFDGTEFWVSVREFALDIHLKLLLHKTKYWKYQYVKPLQVYKYLKFQKTNQSLKYKTKFQQQYITTTKNDQESENSTCNRCLFWTTADNDQNAIN